MKERFASVVYAQKEGGELLNVKRGVVNLNKDRISGRGQKGRRKRNERPGGPNILNPGPLNPRGNRQGAGISWSKKAALLSKNEG